MVQSRPQDSGRGAFRWTDRGRPEAAVSLFFYPDNRGKMTVVHEFQTLALKPLVARHDGRDAGLPGVGLFPRPIPVPPAPGAESAERLRQMRALASEFKATFGDPPDRTELRARPNRSTAMRWRSPGGTSSTAPSSASSTRPTPRSSSSSRPGPRRRAGRWPGTTRWPGCRAYPLRAEHKGAEVWRADVVTVFGDRTALYFSINDPAEGR